MQDPNLYKTPKANLVENSNSDFATESRPKLHSIMHFYRVVFLPVSITIFLVHLYFFRNFIELTRKGAMSPLELLILIMVWLFFVISSVRLFRNKSSNILLFMATILSLLNLFFNSILIFELSTSLVCFIGLMFSIYAKKFKSV